MISPPARLEWGARTEQLRFTQPNMNEKKIISVIQISGQQITKGRTASGRPGFSHAVLYVFEDGTKVASTETTERKKDLLARIESRDQAAKRGELAGSFNNGEFWGTVQRFSMGAGRLNPEPVDAAAAT